MILYSVWTTIPKTVCIADPTEREPSSGRQGEKLPVTQREGERQERKREGNHLDFIDRGRESWERALIESERQSEKNGAEAEAETDTRTERERALE